MSRRKRNTALPVRLDVPEIQQLSWNMEIGNTFEDNNGSVVATESDTHCDISLLNCQGSSAEIQNVHSSDDEIGNSFYKLAISNEEYGNDSAGLLGYLSSVKDLPSTGKSNTEETSIVVKVHKAMGREDIHGESSETTSSDGKLTSSRGSLNVVATYEQIDSLAYLSKKSIVTVVTNDLVNQSKIMIYLSEAGFTKVTIPSEDPSMGKAHKSMKILMQWLHGQWLPDIEYQPKTHHDDEIESVFNTLKSKESCLGSTSTADNINDLDKLQHPSLVPFLRGYQKRAVHWMIEQETVLATEDKVPHPLWKKISLGDKEACYNPHTGRVCRDQIYHQGYPSGGILADEMGLGKTVEVLACILNNPKQSETKKESNLEILETESNNCLSNDSPSNSICMSDEKESLMNDYDSQDSQLFEPTALNEVQSIPSADISSDPHFTIEAGASNFQHGTEEEHCVGKVTKRSLPLDLNQQHGKKARMESSDILPLHHDVDEQPSDVILPDNKFPLSAGPEVLNHALVEENIEAVESAKIIVEKEKAVRCICGKNKADPKEQVLTCKNCSFSQHPQCIGLKKNDTNEKYICPDCSVKLPLLESNTTLIVSPVTIAHQWLDEIHRHILPGSLNVMIYEGVAKQGFVYPSVLADNDIILTTYDVLKRDFHHLPSQKGNHNYRRPKRYSTWPCPLTCIKFWRICLDEAQMVENTTAKTTETALNLSAVHRWCITGTPIQKTIDDLYGLFLFLGVEPYYRKTWWKKLLHEPFMSGNSKPLSDVLYNVMWRTAKKDVIGEINLPEQKESMNWLNFSPVEYHFYRRQHEECSRFALKELNKFQESETELNSLDRYSVHKVLWPLLKLRQACCHPQAVRGGYLAIQKSVITMDQLLESLICKAKNESQDAHRQLLCALNGLAGTYILQENWQDAVDVYREAMASWKEHDELFKTDSLQKLHTLHNLHDVLKRFDSNTRTLRDDSLQEEAAELREKYLQKWKEQVTAAEKEAFNAWQAHDELKQKVDLKCPWWMTYLQDIIDRKNPGDELVSNRLIDKIKTDLTAVRNTQEHGYVSMTKSFSDLRGLQLLLVQKFQAVEDCQDNLFIELKRLMVEPTDEMVVSAAECCLRPATNSTAESCCFCRGNDILSVYESLIFGHQGVSNNDPESVSNSIGGLRGETEAIRTLKSIYAFLKSESKRHYKYDAELQQQAQCHLEYLDFIKKKFKVYRQLWHALRQRVSALDELAMCTMRLRLRYPGEVVPDNQFYIVNPTEVQATQLGFRSDKTLANSSLRKCLGQLLYLKNLAKTQSTDSGENSELCPVCTKVLGYEWSVFSCGHCLCCQCMWALLERPGIPGRTGANVRCPMCRANTMVQDISYVSTIRQLNEEDKDLVVKGSHSTKIEAAVRTLMRIQRTDPCAKTLVFSTWQDVLDVISCALQENNMKFRSIRRSKDYQSSLEEFKTSDDVPILLIPLQSGSNGLNIIEATHVILVEPSLNPSLERQAVGRIHRIGQTKPTFIHRLLIASTVEEKIVRFLQNKVESGLRCGTRRTDRENIPLTVGELAGFFQPTEKQQAI